MANRSIEYWVIPPECDAEFVAQMENVLETYEKPCNPSQPVICMDEQPVQLIKETRQPIPATKDQPQRVDYEYDRNGTVSIFGSSAESVGTNPLKTEFASANDGIFERKHQGWKSLSV